MPRTEADPRPSCKFAPKPATEPFDYVDGWAFFLWADSIRFDPPQFSNTPCNPTCGRKRTSVPEPLVRVVGGILLESLFLKEFSVLAYRFLS